MIEAGDMGESFLGGVENLFTTEGTEKTFLPQRVALSTEHRAHREELNRKNRMGMDGRDLFLEKSIRNKCEGASC
jgi:hypothetical protein